MKQYIWILALLFLTTSCNSFLKEYSQDLAYARTTTDLEELLLGKGYASRDISYPWLHLMDDDLAESVLDAENATRTLYDNYFTWARYPSSEDNEVVKDEFWVNMYKNISTVNVVLASLDEIEGEPEDIERLQGECHFLRGYFYWFLANVYAKPYVQATAETDLGVPLKTTEYIEDGYFSRNTLQETYDLILEDLQESARLLKGKERQTVLQADYYAVQALLSRVYLHVGDFESALVAADSALQGGYTLLNYNDFPQTLANTIDPSIDDIQPVSVLDQTSTETIFSQGGNTFGGGTDYLGLISPSGIAGANKYKASDELLSMYTKEQAGGTDLRRMFYFYYVRYDRRKIYLYKMNTLRGKTVSSEFLIRLPEVMLNKAEALVVLGRDAEAQQLVEDLREMRIDAADYQPLDARTGEALMELIRDERRRELCGEGHRWFDLRRYAVHPVYPSTKEIIHDHYNYNTSIAEVEYLGSYRLEEYENEPAYVIPIPVHAIEYNNGMLVDNEERPEREAFMRF